MTELRYDEKQRLATIDIERMINAKIDIDIIIYEISKKYGFGTTFCHKRIAIIEKRNELFDNGKTATD